MAQMNISLPDALKAWAEQRVAEGRYSSTSDYVRDLMRRDQDEAQQQADWLQRQIDEGLASGFDPRPASEVLVEIMARNRTGRG
jgi:antitoxin ParD1/3/4